LETPMRFESIERSWSFWDWLDPVLRAHPRLVTNVTGARR
jgi:hypothetical protein